MHRVAAPILRKAIINYINRALGVNINLIVIVILIMVKDLEHLNILTVLFF